MPSLKGHLKSRLTLTCITFALTWIKVTAKQWTSFEWQFAVLWNADTVTSSLAHTFKKQIYHRLVSPRVWTYLFVSNFSLPSWTLSDLWTAWESWDIVELSVLTPEVATASSMTMQGCWIVWFWGCSSWSTSTSISSWSAVSLSDARLKCGLNSVSHIKTQAEEKKPLKMLGIN